MLAGTMLILNSCTKTGPQGPQGPQGNANVKGSDGFSVSASSWTFNTGENAWWVSFVDQDITSVVSNHGEVEIFLYYPSDQTWRNLPDIINGTQFYFRYNTGGFDIYYGNVNGTAPLAPTSTFIFRSVVIAPGFRQSHPNVNVKNYSELTAAMATANANASNVAQN